MPALALLCERRLSRSSVPIRWDNRSRAANVCARFLVEAFAAIVAELPG
jgi:hypothetical protein